MTCVQFATDMAQLHMWVLFRTYGMEVPVNWVLPPDIKYLPEDMQWPLRAIWQKEK